MKRNLSKKWVKNLKALDVAFQPILNIHTGKIFAVEALLRNHKEVGFDSIFDLFDSVYNDSLLYAFDLKLRKKTLKKFIEIDGFEDIKLFYNLDNRVLEMPDFKKGNTNKYLKQFNIDRNNICFEISERHQFSTHTKMQEILNHYKEEKFCIAIDDFGVGYSGYKLLYESKPDIVKIDRFFLNNIQKDPKKKLMTRSIVHLAIQLGIKVVAEGIETKDELFICRDIGCHFIQGYLIQRPTTDTARILQNYPIIEELLQGEKRALSDNCKIEEHLDKREAFSIYSDMHRIIEYFQKNPQVETLVVVNSQNEPLGILQEKRIKEFIYSPYGRSLMINNTTKKSKLKNIIEPCGITEVNCNMSTVIELFSNNPESIGIVLTNNSKYYGFLSARAIITIMNEQNIIHAREQNPLTKLPGNSMIEKYLSEVSISEKCFILCYFDLDHFKAFNDVYGFRNGDRAIMLFADILRKSLPSNFFKGHIGGDDFFVAVETKKEKESSHLESIAKVVKKFQNDARDLYHNSDKRQGYMIATDRDLKKKKFPLLCVSASVLVVRNGTKKREADYLNETLSLQKKAAKKEINHISISCLL